MQGKYTSRFGKNLITLGLVGLMSVFNCFNIGCGTPAQNQAVGGAAVQNIARTNPNLKPQQRQSLGAFGGLMGVLAQQQAMKEAAREVNANNYKGQNNNQIIEDEVHTVFGVTYGTIIKNDSNGIVMIDSKGNNHTFTRATIKRYMDR
jgi:hypothetical protein